jgi:hypothetical protein
MNISASSRFGVCDGISNCSSFVNLFGDAYCFLWVLENSISSDINFLNSFSCEIFNKKGIFSR